MRFLNLNSVLYIPPPIKGKRHTKNLKSEKKLIVIKTFLLDFIVRITMLKLLSIFSVFIMYVHIISLK